MGCDYPSVHLHSQFTYTLYNIQQHTFAECLFARRFNAERYLCILSRTGPFGSGRLTFLEYNAFKGSNFGDMKSKATNSSSLSEAMLLTADYVPYTIIATDYYRCYQHLNSPEAASNWRSSSRVIRLLRATPAVKRQEMNCDKSYALFLWRYSLFSVTFLVYNYK